MNLSMKQKQTHRQKEQTWLPRVGEGWNGSLGLYRMDKQQDPTV